MEAIYAATGQDQKTLEKQSKLTNEHLSTTKFREEPKNKFTC